MSSVSRTDHRWWIQDQPYWLPPAGTGNGLGAMAWAPIADLPMDRVAAALAACARAGIAAYAAPTTGMRPLPRRRRRGQRLWVDSQRFGAAEDVLRPVLHAVM